jgi:mannosyl-oligosaccharide alpha-1,2-mannosidase
MDSERSGQAWCGLGAHPLPPCLPPCLPSSQYWILRGKRDDHWRARWVNSTDAALAELVIRPEGVNFTFTGEKGSGQRAAQPTISHLGCFYPGSVALGVISGAVRGAKAEAYLEFARSMMHACFQLYNATATGLGADEAVVDLRTGEVRPTHLSYMQRPEVVESLFYLWRATRDQRYRDWGWAILGALERHCRKDAGYSGTGNVQEVPPRSDDVQQSWFLAETLKYLYLLYRDDAAMPLDEWVFNTEAHPVRAERPAPRQPWIDWSWMVPPEVPDVE